MSAWDVRSPIMDQIDDLADRLARLSALRERDSPHAPAAALDAAHATLRLAVAAVADEDEQMIRHEMVMDVLPVLARVGLGHVRDLVEAALAHNVAAGRLVQASAILQ